MYPNFLTYVYWKMEYYELYKIETEDMNLLLHFHHFASTDWTTGVFVFCFLLRMFHEVLLVVGRFVMMMGGNRLVVLVRTARLMKNEIERQKYRIWKLHMTATEYRLEFDKN